MCCRTGRNTWLLHAGSIRIRRRPGSRAGGPRYRRSAAPRRWLRPAPGWRGSGGGVTGCSASTKRRQRDAGHHVPVRDATAPRRLLVFSASRLGKMSYPTKRSPRRLRSSARLDNRIRQHGSDSGSSLLQERALRIVEARELLPFVLSPDRPCGGAGVCFGHAGLAGLLEDEGVGSASEGGGLRATEREVPAPAEVHEKPTLVVLAAESRDDRAGARRAGDGAV